MLVPAVELDEAEEREAEATVPAADEPGADITAADNDATASEAAEADGQNAVAADITSSGASAEQEAKPATTTQAGMPLRSLRPICLTALICTLYIRCSR